MGFSSSSSSCCRLHLLIVLVIMVAKGSSTRDIAQIRLKEADDDYHQEHTHAHQMDGMEDDPSVRVFFSINDLKLGKTIPLYFSLKDPSISPHLLSREEADSIPFSSAQLPYLLQFFSFSKESPQAKAMEYTLRQCELEPMEGETKFCATSLETLLDSARAVFGSKTQLKALITSHLTKPTTPLQNYTIFEEPKEILAPKMLGCHAMPYPYVVYYCHIPGGENKAFEMLLRGENGETVKATGVCHMDTSKWDPDNLSFRLLKTKPGSSPVCHVSPADNIVWVPLSA